MVLIVLHVKANIFFVGTTYQDFAKYMNILNIGMLKMSYIESNTSNKTP